MKTNSPTRQHWQVVDDCAPLASASVLLSLESGPWGACIQALSADGRRGASVLVSLENGKLNAEIWNAAATNGVPITTIPLCSIDDLKPKPPPRRKKKLQ